jgi:Lamin Tail Domain
MYHPPGDGLAEFIELTNISTSTTLDLTGVRFTQGIDFDFTGSAIASLAPGARVLVVRNAAAFQAMHGAGKPVAGVFANSSALSNGGEAIKLEDADNGTVQELTYDDAPPWPAGADGTGYSLVLIAPHTNPDPDLAVNWRSSARRGGTPDGTDIVTFPSNPAGDANGNGLSDLIDYALGIGLGGVSILPTVVEGESGGSSAVIYPLSLGAERATIEVLVSSDLTQWHEGTSYLEAPTIEPLGDGRALVTRRVISTPGENARLFLRLRVSAP